GSNSALQDGCESRTPLYRKKEISNQSKNVPQHYEKKDNDSFLPHNFGFLILSGARVKHKVTCNAAYARAVFSGNSNPTLPSSNFRYAANGRPRFEMKPSRRSVFPVVRSFSACSFGMSRPRIVLLSLNLHGVRSACERSQM